MKIFEKCPICGGNWFSGHPTDCDCSDCGIYIDIEKNGEIMGKINFQHELYVPEDFVRAFKLLSFQ